MRAGATFFFQGGRAIFLGCVALCASLVGIYGGDKITFSEVDRKIEVPKTPIKDELLSPTTKEKARSGSAPAELPYIPPQNSGNAIISPKLEKLIDQRQNWVYNRPEDLESQGPNIDELLGLDPAKVVLAEKPKKGMERYFENESDKKSTLNKKDQERENPLDQQERTETNPLSLEKTPSLEPRLPEAPSINPEFNLNNYLHPNFGREEKDAFSRKDQILKLQPGNYGFVGTTPPTSAAKKERIRLEEIRLQEFQKLLQPRAPMVTGSSVIDPINASPDSTRQEINPIIPRRNESVIDTLTRPAYSEPPKSTFATTPSAAGGSSYQSLLPSFQAGSSLSPSTLLPPSLPAIAPRNDPRPVFEIPKRKF